MKNLNFNELNKKLKSNLKRKVSITQKTMIAFLITGIFGMSMQGFAGYNNAALPTWINAGEIPGNWVFTNTEPDTAKTITGDNNIVLGRSAGGNISGTNNFIVGQTGAGGKTTGINNILMGQAAGISTSGHNNVALGDRAGQNVTGNNNFAAGPYESGTGVNGYFNIAIGNQTGQNVGYAGTIAGLESSNDNTGMGRNNIAIGRLAGNRVQGNENIAIGARVGENVGSDAKNNGQGIYNVVVGVESGNNVQGVSNVTLGRGAGNNVKGSYNFMVGQGAGDSTLGDHNIILGHNAGNIGTETANETISIGAETKATKNNVTAIGFKAQALETKTLALGGEALADVENSIALGDKSDTEASASVRTKGNDKSYTSDNIVNKLALTFAGGNQVVGVVSVGNATETRRIQNVAPGLISETSTDAINGSQLYALAKKVANINTTGGGAGNPITYVVEPGKNTYVTPDDKTEGIKKYTIDAEKTVVAVAGGVLTIQDDAASNKNDYVNTYTISLEKTDLTVEDGKVSDIPTKDQNKVVTAETVKNAINNSGFKVKAEAAGGTIAVPANAVSTLVKSGEEVKFKAGKNVTIDQNGKEFTFSVDLPAAPAAPTVNINGDKYITVEGTNNNFTLTTKKGEINTDKPKILVKNNLTGLASVEDVVAGVNALGNNTIKLGGDTGTTDAQNLNKENGLQFNVKGDGFIKTEAKGSDVIVSLSDEVKEKINNIEDKAKSEVTAANSGVASAVAMANLPQVSNIAGHRHNIAGAYGYYNGEHAFALGISGLNETGNLVYKASGSLNTKGHVALGAGLGYQFDKLESRRKDMLTLQRNGNINLLDEKVYELDQEVTTLKDKVNNLEKANKELNEKLDKLIEKFMK